MSANCITKENMQQQEEKSAGGIFHVPNPVPIDPMPLPMPPPNPPPKGKKGSIRPRQHTRCITLTLCCVSQHQGFTHPFLQKNLQILGSLACRCGQSRGPFHPFLTGTYLNTRQKTSRQTEFTKSAAGSWR